MGYQHNKMNIEEAVAISRWTYPKPYDIYSFESSQSVLDEFINEGYCSIYQDSDLIGYYCTGKSAQVPADKSKEIYKNDNYIDFGLGMKPQLTGIGKGSDFFSFIIECIKNEYPDKKLRLTVAQFNKRAIHLYQGFGFKCIFEFNKPNLNVDFIIMVQK